MSYRIRAPHTPNPKIYFPHFKQCYPLSRLSSPLTVLQPLLIYFYFVQLSHILSPSCNSAIFRLSMIFCHRIFHFFSCHHLVPSSCLVSSSWISCLLPPPPASSTPANIFPHSLPDRSVNHRVAQFFFTFLTLR